MELAMQIPSSVLPNTFSQGSSSLSSNTTQGVVIEIKPGADNTSEGDRSKNVAEISVTTPNKTLSTEVSREQFVSSIERRAQKQALEQLTAGNSVSVNPLLLAAAKNGDIDTEQISDLSSALYQRRVAQSYVNAYQGNTGSLYSPSPSNNNVGFSSNNPTVNFVNQATNAYIKQTLFFSSVDQAKSTFSGFS